MLTKLTYVDQMWPSKIKKVSQPGDLENIQDRGLGRHFEENPAERADDRRPVHVELGSLQDLRHVQGQDFRALEDNRSSVVVPLGEQAKFSEPVAHNLRLSRAAAFFEKTEYLPRNFEPSTS